jgi:hypothetical protein
MALYLIFFLRFVHCWCIEKLLIFISYFVSDTRLKLFLGSRSFWVKFFGPLRYRIMSSANRHTLSISLHTCIPYFFFLPYFSDEVFQDYVE